MASIRNAKEVIRTELEKSEFNSDSVAIIEQKIAELEAARLDWRSDAEIVGLHQRYLVKFEALDDSIKRNLSAQIEAARQRQEALRAEISGIELPSAVLGSPEIMKELQRLGIVRGDRAVFENTEVQEKVEKYLHYLNFISNVERDGRGAIQKPEELVSNYRELINEGTDWILDKRYLQYKYIEAIYNDIIRRGYVLEKHGTTGEYRIVCPKTETVGGTTTIVKTDLIDTHPNHPYLDVLKARNTRNLIDVAMVTSIMSKNFSLERKDIVGQKTFITSILQQHNIKSRSGTAIQSADLLLLEWNDVVLPQVEEKLQSVIGPDREVSTQAYQELMYLKNFIEREEYNQPDYNRDIFREANIYRKGFLNEKALIDAFGGDIGNATPESLGEIIQKMGGEAQGPLLIMAVFALLAGFKKTALGAAGLALLWPSVGSLIDTGIQGAKNTGDLLSDEDLELIKPQNIIPVLENSEYQAQFEKLANINKTNLDRIVDAEGRSLPYVQNNFIIAKILNEIHKSGKDVDLSASNAVTEIMNAMAAKDVTNAEFPNFHGTPYTIKRTDVQSFIKLTETDGFREAGDTTLSDAFTEGRDIRNESYTSENFTTDENFEKELNDTLRARWTANTTVVGRETIKSLKEKIEAKLSAGIADNFFDSVTGRNTEDVIRGLPERLWNIDDLIAEIDSMVVPGPNFGKNEISRTTADQLIDILKKYKTFMEADAKLSEYDGIWGKATALLNDITSTTKGLIERATGATGIAELEREIASADAEIAKIDAIIATLGGGTLFSSLLERANTIKKWYEDSKTALQEEIDRRNQELRDRVFGPDAREHIAGLRLNESEQWYRETAVKIEKAIQDFSNAVTEFERTSDINVMFRSQNIDDYKLITAAKTELDGMRLTWTPDFPNKLWLRVTVNGVFGSGKAMEKFKNKTTEALTQYYANNKTTLDDVNDINSTFTDVDTLIDNIASLNRADEDLRAQVWITAKALEFIRLGDARSNTEKTHELARGLFWASYSIPNESITIKSVLEAVVTKREALEEGLKDYINGISTADINTLRILQSMETRGIFDSIESEQVKRDFASKMQEITIEVINNVDSTPSGLDTLVEINDILHFNQDNGIFKKIIEAILGSSFAKTKFEEKLSIVWTSILDSFNEDMDGLNEIVTFKSSGNYGWIKERTSNFDSKYNDRLNAIREAVKSNTTVGSIVSITNISTRLAGGYPSGDPRIALEAYEAGSTKTLADLITLLGLENTPPRGTYGSANFTEADRTPFYNELKRLNILW